MAEVIYETQNARSLMERVVIGVEVETSNDDSRDCDSCDICDICTTIFASACEVCEALGLSAEIAELLELPEDASPEMICRACADARADGSLDFCDIAREHLCFDLVCENCEGPGYCSAVEELCCARGPYIDRSCGWEYPLMAVPLDELPGLLQTVKDYLGSDLRPLYGCGGHTNISIEDEVITAEIAETVIANARYFADILAYLFLTDETHGRNYDYRRFNADNDVHTDKYSLINVKGSDSDYFFEFRFPDTPMFPNAHVILSACLGAIVAHAYRTQEWYPVKTERAYIIAGARYEKCCKGLFDEISDAGLRAMRKKLEKFKNFYREELVAASEILGVDIFRLLDELWETPMHRRSEDLKL